MKLQDQVCTLEQAKRLKELGVGQEAYFSIADRNGGIVMPRTETDDEYVECYTAFTVAELGVMLPDEVEKDGLLSIEKTFDEWEPSKWVAGYRNWWTRVNLCSSNLKDTEAEARAALLIHLLESGKVTADEANSRLNA